MDNERIQRLLERVNSGIATEAEVGQLEKLVEAGTVATEDIEAFSMLEQQIMQLEAPLPSAGLDHRFYRMLSQWKGHRKEGVFPKLFNSLPVFAPRFAVAVIILIAGMAAGYFLRFPGGRPADEQIAVLSHQVSDLQEMMMLSLLEKGSTTERLKAVNLTQEMSEASKKVTTALIQTLNRDENVNVRLAALEALKPYAGDSSVRKALVESIGRQESPLVQISLAELMVALQEKAAVKEFERIVDAEETPAEVKAMIKESIQVLI